MKIKSRPTGPEDFAVGSGEFILALTEEQLRLIASLNYCTRLGAGGPYSDAAFELSNLIDEVTGDKDFEQDSYDDVAPTIAEHDRTGQTIKTITDFSIEV